MGKALRVIQSKVVRSLPSGTFNDLHVFVRPGAVAAAQPNHKNSFPVVGAFSRAISVSGGSFQVCGHHNDYLLSQPNLRLGITSENALMAECSISNLTCRPAGPSVAAYRSFSSYRRRNFDDCRKASMTLRNKEQPNSFLRHGYSMYIAANRKGNPNPFFGSGSEGFPISSTACSPTGTARDLSFDNSIREGQQSSSVDSSELDIPTGSSLKLNSGSCYLPHPDKEETGGEDAHFICMGAQAIGVADGVGADLGVDAREYARELMSNSLNAIQEEPRGSIDPARVLKKAYTSTKAKGSATACIIALTNQGLRAINVGDSGFMVVRDGCTVFRSPGDGQVFTIPVAPGDVIIAGTDGLFDNLYNNDITAVVVDAVRSGFGPQVAAQKIAALARERSQDKNRQTPFSTAAQEAGVRYYGGKLDDITVVVSYIGIDLNQERPSAKSSD